MNPYQHSFDGNIPQDVAGKQGENVIFIVYTCQKEMKSIQIYKMYEIYYNKHAF